MRLVVRAVPLAALFLLTLGSAAPGDTALAVVLAVAVAAWVQPLLPADTVPRLPLPRRVGAFVVLAGVTTASVVAGAVRVMRCCLLGPPTGAAGLVEVPIDGRSPTAIAAWGVRTGLTPDEVVVDVDTERGVLLIHALDATDPDGLRARHRDDYRRRQRRVFP